MDSVESGCRCVARTAQSLLGFFAPATNASLQALRNALRVVVVQNLEVIPRRLAATLLGMIQPAIVPVGSGISRFSRGTVSKSRD
jgi:hypothetical protein